MFYKEFTMRYVIVCYQLRVPYSHFKPQKRALKKLEKEGTYYGHGKLSSKRYKEVKAEIKLTKGAQGISFMCIFPF